MKTALIGYGYWGPNLARNMMMIDEKGFMAICEADPNRLAKAKNMFGERVNKYTTDFKEIIENPEIEAVVIATQTEPSYEIVMSALEAHKHVFIEKPIATTVERTVKIQEKALEKKCIVHCDHIMIYNPVIRYIKDLLDRGEMGELTYIDISRVNLGPIRKDVNSMLDLAVHDIAVIDYLSGGQKPTSLSALGQKLYGNQESLTYLTLKYPDFIAHIKSSWVSPLKERRMIIGGTKKMVIFDDVKMTEKLTIYDHGIDINMDEEYGTYEFETRTGDIFIPNIKFEDSLKNSLLHFYDCVGNNCTSETDVIHSLRVMKILESAMNEIRK